MRLSLHLAIFTLGADDRIIPPCSFSRTKILPNTDNFLAYDFDV